MDNNANADDMEDPGLYDVLEQVRDRDSFLIFVRALIADRENELSKERVTPSSPWGPGANGWENGSIEGFLSAALAWAEARVVQTRGDFPEEPSWRAFAEFLHCGKIYE